MLNPAHFLKNSIRYEMLRSYLSFCNNFIFYKKVIVKNFPAELEGDTPLIIVTNHQNTLMDPLSVLFNCGWLQPIFLARADVFKNKLFVKILTFLKILPVYRKQDDVENMNAENDKIFDQCVELLQKKRSIVIFPEGNHGVLYRLRPLKKGTARIALKAESESNWELGVKILPCGVHYTHCQKMGETLTLNFGQCIEIQDYKEEFTNNQPRSYTTLTNKIKESLLSLMFHIEDEAHYNEILFLAELNQGKEPLDSARKIIEQLNALPKEQYEEKLAEAAKLKVIFDQNKLDALSIRKGLPSKFQYIIAVLSLILRFPMAVIGYLTNVIPFSLPFLLTNKLKDKQFTSAYRFVLYFLVTFPIYYFISFFVLLYFFDLRITYIVVFFSLCFGLFAHQWARSADRIRQLSYLCTLKLKNTYSKLTSWD